jgi:hypothetical protein
MKFRIRHAAVPAALLGLGLLATACGGSSGTAATPSTAHSSPTSGSSSAAQGSTSTAPASSAPAPAGQKCPAGDIAAATQLAVPAQQQLEAAGFTPDTSVFSGTVYVNNTQLNIKVCGWTGDFTNHSLGLTAGVGLGFVSFMGTGDRFIQGTSPTPSVAVYEQLTQQALQTPSIWSALRPGGPSSIVSVTTTGIDGTTVGVGAFETATPVPAG